MSSGGGEMGGRSTPPHCLRSGARAEPPAALQVLTRIDDPLDAPELLFRLAHERLHVDDPLTLLAGDLGPVVRVGGVGEIFVLLELLADGGEEAVGQEALSARPEERLEGGLLGRPTGG